jgi:N-methylhydantoinase B
MIDVIFSTAAQFAPDRAVANAYGTINALSIAGKRANGKPWVMFSFYGGGHGGSLESDGLNHGNAPISTATIPPMEILEAAYPVMFKQWALRPDSAGPGRHRGGLGAVYEIELLDDSAEAFLFGERGRFAPQGVVGGGEGAMNHFEYQQDDGWHEPPLTSKMRGIKLTRGQSVRLETPGGGGYGPAAERSADAVARDVALGYLTPAAAARHYPKTGDDT